jgi:acyl CoA:acetate/3-ketoacid CoA transferase beta subunit
MKVTPDEMMVVSMSRQLINGEVVAQGIATPLVAAAYLLARHTHAPDLYFSSAIGQGICRQPAPMSLLQIERLWLDNALNNAGFIRAVADVLPSLRPKEFFRPGQVDPHGNFNNIAFGKNYRMPRLRLPGTGGIPDVTTFIDDICLYVPRHSRITFVAELDYLSGLGHHPSRTRGQGPRYLVSDLGEFDFQGLADGKPVMRLVSYHPGASVELIQKKTGFDLTVAPDVSMTPLPSETEIDLLRAEIDPMGIRKLELLSGSERRAFLRQIILQESKTASLFNG